MKIDQMKMLLCPRCKIEMKKLQKEKVTIDVCTKCKGMWLDDGEIGKLAKMMQKVKVPQKS